MKKTTRILKESLATLLAAVATGSAGAMAAPPYHFSGSETLAEVTKDSITQCEISGFCTPGSLLYDAGGSRAAEDALLYSSPFMQRIAPMSRNFRATTLTVHPNWAPQMQNIIGLDAVVIVEKSAASGFSKCPNLSSPLAPGGNAQVDTLIGLVLGGKGGAGTFAACSHPDRLAAVDALAACFQGISLIDHFYRPDDYSGTSDLMKEKFGIQGFCNGISYGSAGTYASISGNLDNSDADPIRRTCVAAATGTYAKTACTLWPTPTKCTAGEANCTQGLVVALSQNDPGMPTIATTIARRARLDANNQTVGFAGREASRQTGNAAPNINTISPNNFNIRASAYLASRRLFLNISDIAVGTGRAGGQTADDIASDADQMNLYTWMTDPVLGGRFNVDPILIAHGFLPCTDDSSDPIGAGNLCSSQLPPPAAEDTPGSCIPAGDVGNGTNTCCSTGAISPYPPGWCPENPCSVANAACTGSSQGTCCTGLTCTDQGTGNFACN